MITYEVFRRAGPGWQAVGTIHRKPTIVFDAIVKDGTAEDALAKARSYEPIWRKRLGE